MAGQILPSLGTIEPAGLILTRAGYTRRIIMNGIYEKREKLLELLRDMQRVVVAYSGGVDSAFLAAAAERAVQKEAVAITACSETLPQSERAAARLVADTIGIRHLEMDISELNSAEFVNNDAQRCYFCKKERFGVLVDWAQENGFAWVLDGANADDVSDYRPGMRAVGEMAQVRSPLLEVGLTKAEIRVLSQEWGLPTWDKPSSACLSSRIAYGLPVTAERLYQIEQAEEILRKFCSGQIRVRHHGDLARIEVAPENIPLLVQQDNAAVIADSFKKLGFSFVTVDLAGYRTGSMNAVL